MIFCMDMIKINNRKLHRDNWKTNRSHNIAGKISITSKLGQAVVSENVQEIPANLGEIIDSKMGRWS